MDDLPAGTRRARLLDLNQAEAEIVTRDVRVPRTINLLAFDQTPEDLDLPKTIELSEQGEPAPVSRATLELEGQLTNAGTSWSEIEPAMSRFLRPELFLDWEQPTPAVCELDPNVETIILDADGCVRSMAAYDARSAVVLAGSGYPIRVGPDGVTRLTNSSSVAQSVTRLEDGSIWLSGPGFVAELNPSNGQLDRTFPFSELDGIVGAMAGGPVPGGVELFVLLAHPSGEDDSTRDELVRIELSSDGEYVESFEVGGGYVRGNCQIAARRHVAWFGIGRAVAINSTNVLVLEDGVVRSDRPSGLGEQGSLTAVANVPGEGVQLVSSTEQGAFVYLYEPATHTWSPAVDTKIELVLNDLVPYPGGLVMLAEAGVVGRFARLPEPDLRTEPCEPVRPTLWSFRHGVRIGTDVLGGTVCRDFAPASSETICAPEGGPVILRFRFGSQD